MAVIAIAVLFCAGIAYWLSFSSIPNNRTGADAVRADIQSVISEQSRAIDRLGTIETGLDDSATKAGELSAGIESIASSIDSVAIRIAIGENRLADSQQLIEEGQRILNQVRARGQK